MEILQTIWNALISENQLLINIISFPMLVVELTVSMLLFTTILNINPTRMHKLLYVILLSGIGIITSCLVPAPYNTFINIIACPILVYFIFKTNILKSILAEIIPYAFFVTINSILLKIVVNIFPNISIDLIFKIPIIKLACSLIMYLITFLMYIIFKKLSINITLLEKLKKKDTLILFINFIIGIIAISVQLYLATVYSKYISLPITLASIFILLIYFSISIYSLLRTNKLEATTQSLEEERLYNKTLTILYDNIRIFKHDFNNIVQAIGGYISTNDVDGLKDYYSDLMSDCQKINNLAILNPELINNPAIYSLLTSKYHKAEEVGVKINFEIFLDLATLNIKTYDLSRILGILLDNAIEASSKCDEKIIYVTIRKDNKVNRQLFIIENTYLDKSIDTERIFEKGYTSKTASDGKNHGLGLWEVRKFLKKNNNLNLFTTKDNRLFKQQLEIYF